ncbi:MAG: M56 family metallopeptidase [Clostridiales bacterium]|jgi:beta-lactamase regulating signal transducer with metallopeptidase domain|nr:M56 family metallopeptidase [Clostridiales bacterium]
MLTIPAIVNGVISSGIIILAVSKLTNNKKAFQSIGVTTLLLILSLVVLRLALPFELPFTKPILSSKVLPFFNMYIHENYFFGKFTVLHLLITVWILGGAFKACKNVLRYIKLRTTTKLFSKKRDRTREYSDICLKFYNIKIPDNLKIIKSNSMGAPVIFGLIKPVIIIPDEEYTEEELSFILCHELIHFLKKDLWVKLILEVICIVYWWNYFVIVELKKAFANIMECRADFSVIELLNEHDRIEYLKFILEESKKRKQIISTPLQLNFANNYETKRLSNIEKRIHFGLEYDKNKKFYKSKIICIFITVVLIIASFLVVVQSHHSYIDDAQEGEILFSINENNAYIVQYSNDRYTTFLNDGTELFTLPYIDESLKNLPVYHHGRFRRKVK